MKRRLVVLIGAISLIVAGGIAYASIPGPDGVIHGCYKNSTGMLIAIDSAASCPTGYTALNWNQTGPQGPPGLSGYEIRTQAFTSGPGSGLNVDVSCSGKSVLGGGYDVTGSPGYTVTGSHPQGSGWRITFTYSGPGFTEVLNVWATCATVAT